jgi:hypothetical protein
MNTVSVEFSPEENSNVIIDILNNPSLFSWKMVAKEVHVQEN